MSVIGMICFQMSSSLMENSALCLLCYRNCRRSCCLSFHLNCHLSYFLNHHRKCRPKYPTIRPKCRSKLAEQKVRHLVSMVWNRT